MNPLSFTTMNVYLHQSGLDSRGALKTHQKTPFQFMDKYQEAMDQAARNTTLAVVDHQAVLETLVGRVEQLSNQVQRLGQKLNRQG